MLSATILLACTSVVSSRSSSAIPERTKQKHNHPNNNSHVHLPQHRIRRPERQVPYPKYHPLSRYLRLKDDNGNNHQNNIKNDNKIEDEEQSLQPRRGQQQSRRRRRNINNYHDEEESIIEDKVVLDNTGELLHYWTVTGRNLITSSTSSSFTEGGVSGSDGAIGTTNDEISDESAKLLMDVNELTSSNSTSSASGGDYDEGSISAGGDESDANDETVEMSLPYNNDQSTPPKPEFNSETTIKDTLESAVDTIIDTIEAAAESTTSTTTTEQTSIYQPIRLRAIFTDDQTSGFQYLTDTQRTILMEQIVNPALFAWSKALSVVPVGNGDHDGDTNDMDDSLVVDKTQLYDGESCGPGLVSLFVKLSVYFTHAVHEMPCLVPLTTNSSWSLFFCNRTLAIQVCVFLWST